MLRKFFGLYFTGALIAVAFYACNCKEQGHHVGIYEVYFQWYRTAQNSPDDTLFIGDTLAFNFQLQTQCIAQNRNYFSPFINASFATTPRFCPCGDEGLKSAVNGFKIFTNQSYGSYGPGVEITPLFSFYTRSLDSVGVERNTYYSQSQIPDLLNQTVIEDHQQRFIFREQHLFLTQKPGDNLVHTFTLHILTADSTYTVTCPPVKWL